MAFTDAEKEELFADFQLRMAEMDKADKRLNAAKNMSAMKDFTRYYMEMVDSHNSRTAKNEWLYAQDPSEGRWYYNAYGLYEAYCALRKAIPLAVGVKHQLNHDDIPKGSVSYRKTYVLDPEEDREEAFRCGKALLDAMISYLKGENEHE